LDKKIVINMLSSADKVEGQGVGSAYLEQVNLVKEGASDLFTVEINSGKKADIIHSHTIDPQNYLKMKNNKNANVCYVHFLPDTLNGSIQLPKALFSVFKKYVISFYKTADYLIVVNPIFMEELEKYGIAREKMIYIPNYVSKEQFYVKPVEQRNAIREQYGIKADLSSSVSDRYRHERACWILSMLRKSCRMCALSGAEAFRLEKLQTAMRS